MPPVALTTDVNHTKIYQIPEKPYIPGAEETYRVQRILMDNNEINTMNSNIQKTPEERVTTTY